MPYKRWGSIEAKVNGTTYKSSYSLANTILTENYYDPSTNTLKLHEEGWTISIDLFYLNQITLPYTVPSNDFNISFSQNAFDGINPNYTYISKSNSAPQGCTLEITSINGNVYEGNFSGKLYQYNYSTQSEDCVTLDVTDGRFSVELK